MKRQERRGSLNGPLHRSGRLGPAYDGAPSMRVGISWLAWLTLLTFALCVFGVIVLMWNVNPHTPAGTARLIGSVVTGIVAVLTLISGALTGMRMTAIEVGRYPRLRAGAYRRIAERIQRECRQTVTMDVDGGDAVREVAVTLGKALRSAKWHVRPMRVDGPLWDNGKGIMVYHTEAAASAATALVAALRAEALPAADAGTCTTGTPIHIALN